MSTIRNLSPWRASADFIRNHKRTLTFLWFVGIFLPLIIVEYNQTTKSLDTVQTLLTRYAQKDPSSLSALALYEEAISFISQSAISWLLACFFVAIGYLSIVRFVLAELRFMQEQSLPSVLLSSTLTCLRKGIPSATLTYLIIGLLVVSSFTIPLLGFVSQIALLTTIALSVYIPVAIVAFPRKGSFRLTLSLLSLKFFPKIKGLKWAIFFQAMTWQLFLVVCFSLAGWLRETLANLDMILNLPRDFFLIHPSWNHNYGNLNLLQYLAGFLDVLIYSISLAFIAIISTIYLIDLQKLIAISALYQAKQEL